MLILSPIMPLIKCKDRPLNKKKPIASIFDDKIGLRLLEEKDIELIRTWRNRDDIRFFFKDSKIITAEQQKRWFDAYKERGNDYFFIILWLLGQNYKPVGSVSIYNITDGKAEYGRCMIGDESARRRGIMALASRLLFEIARTQLGVTELSLDVFNNNLRAIKGYEKLGFRKVSDYQIYSTMKLYLRDNER
jgi:RimJ/RimL family protein N-acetyltransferase